MKSALIAIVRFPVRLAVRAAFVVLGLPLLYLVEPFRRVRFGLLYTSRIGHLAGNTDLFLRQCRIDGTDPKAVYVFAGVEPANRQLFEMFKRHLPIYESRWLTRILFYVRPLIQRTRFWESLYWHSPRYDHFNGAPATLAFTAEEEEKGRARLAEMGIGPDDWFVCIHARDPAYLDAHLPGEADLWRTRDFRNCRIENYLKAADYITSLGGYVVRMGAVVERPLPDTGNPRIIDYATKYRSDFMDVYLPAKCRFFLSSDSGLYVVATIFDVPVALANCIYIRLNPFRRDDLFILKPVKETEGGRLLTIDEALERGFYDNRRVHSNSAEYQMVENTPDEILELAKEMIGCLEGRAPEGMGVAMRDIYRRKYCSEEGHADLAPNLGSHFALKYEGLIRAE